VKSSTCVHSALEIGRQPVAFARVRAGTARSRPPSATATSTGTPRQRSNGPDPLTTRPFGRPPTGRCNRPGHVLVPHTTTPSHASATDDNKSANSRPISPRSTAGQRSDREALARADARFAQSWWHWWFFAQSGKPERAILADPDAWYGGDPNRMGAKNYADYRRAIHDPATVRAMLEDYRAGLSIDRAADDADRAAGRRITCPTLVLWASRDDMEELYGDVLAVWRSWTTDLRGGPIDSGHHIAEDAPQELVAALSSFLTTTSA
jgi:pimeloyl-ACP methyl ester carboxylesterase